MPFHSETIPISSPWIYGTIILYLYTHKTKWRELMQGKSPLKWILLIAVIILATAVVGMMFIRETTVNTDITARPTKVGLILTGAKDDSNFCQTHYDALMDIKDELNLEILLKENTPENEACLEAARDLVKRGCDVVIGASFSYSEHLLAAAKEFPEVCFVHTFGAELSENLTSAMGRMYQARYLSGIVAGMRSESGKLGFVAAFPNSEVICGLNAFTRGVRSVSPETVVYVKYCNSWLDDDLARSATEELLAAEPEIDVISMHTNSLAPNRVAEERGIWSVGYNADNAERFPNSYLTACVWNWAPYYKEKILLALQGKFSGRIEWIDMDNGILGLSELTKNTAPGTKEAVEQATERFAAHTFDVFYGPITDNEGNIRVAAGESMTDDEMLYRFSWYVEGVIVED